MTALLQAKQELDDIKTVLASANPGFLLEKAVDFGALLASVNTEVAMLDSLFHKEIKAGLDEGNSATASELVAKSSDVYRKFRAGKGIGESLETTIVSLRRYADVLIEELKITG